MLLVISEQVFSNFVFLALRCCPIFNSPLRSLIRFPLDLLTTLTCQRYGQLSGLVEPFAGVLGAALVTFVVPILPYALVRLSKYLDQFSIHLRRSERPADALRAPVTWMHRIHNSCLGGNKVGVNLSQHPFLICITHFKSKTFLLKT